MTARLAAGGRLLDRSRPLGFSFDGRSFSGYAGDTLASALLANGQLLMGRSFKYHRPRSVVASGAEEPNALVGLGAGARFEPNQRATVAELHEGLQAVSQNRWPSLAFDVGAVNSLAARFLPAGFYYKTFIHPRWAWKHLFEPVIRRSAGLGKPTQGRDPDAYEHYHQHIPLVIAGGGISGLQAALLAGRAGVKLLLVEQTPHWGGRAPVDGGSIDGLPAAEWVAQAVAELESLPNVRLRLRTQLTAVYDHGYLTAWERIADHSPGDGRPRQRLWRIRARLLIAANGAYERPLSFAGNDLPGVMLASAMRDYVVNWAVSPGDRTVVVTNNDDGYRTALALLRAGLVVPRILDARPVATGPLAEAARARGLRIDTCSAVARVEGGRQVRAVAICAQAGEGAVLETIPCEAVAMAGGWSPAVHLWSHCGGKLDWDDARAMFRPDPARPSRGADGQAMVLCAGAASGALTTAEVLADAARTAGEALARLGVTAGSSQPASAEPESEAPLAAVWQMPQAAGPKLRAKTFLDYQNDVKVSDLRLAAQEGYASVEHAKRYTTLGMATDQGKLSNINGLAVLAEALHEQIPRVGTTTFRPPYTPQTFGAMVGEARGPLFLPLRQTAMHDWHEANGASFEPVGHWRRPYAYLRAGEDRAQAILREIRNTRQNVGMMDASTLGKIIVKGPDAGRLLDMIYTGTMSRVALGRCRYGLICNDNGFLIDDGVVVRLSEDTWLCHTTTGGADGIHAAMEDWLQNEWPEWQVYTANVTEQWAQVAVAGPNARALLERLGGIDLSDAGLPFMSWTQGTLGGFAVRLYRISFSGERAFEVSIPAGRGMELWQALLAAGEGLGLQPYGTEAMHVMRAEKGLIMIGDETDGTVIPQDLGLEKMIGSKKPDYLGKRAQARSFMASGDRWKLVGLEAADGSVLPEGAHVPAPGVNANGQRNTQGRVTSTYFSPTLGRGIALALLHRGPERMGETVEVQDGRGGVKAAKVVSPVFFDPEGERQRG